MIWRYRQPPMATAHEQTKSTIFLATIWIFGPTGWTFLLYILFAKYRYRIVRQPYLRPRASTNMNRRCRFVFKMAVGWQSTATTQSKSNMKYQLVRRCRMQSIDDVAAMSEKIKTWKAEMENVRWRAANAAIQPQLDIWWYRRRHPKHTESTDRQANPNKRFAALHCTTKQWKPYIYILHIWIMFTF